MSPYVVDLARALIRRPSVTPADAGAMSVLKDALEALGFECQPMRFGQIENLYARRGTVRPNLCFAGHTDVVPPGDEAAWRAGPFEAEVAEGLLIGRGAVDMKGAIAAFVAAVAAAPLAPDQGSISLLITGDEEGVAIDGTAKVIEQLAAMGEVIDHCVLGEPTSASSVGDQIKVGRRGSFNAEITVIGQQGHVAYPHLADNPIPVLLRLLGRLQGRVLDEGSPGFPASNLEITTIDVANTATNVIPAQARARVNVRFNPRHDGEALAAWMERELADVAQTFGGQIELKTTLTGNAFLTEPGEFVDVVGGAVADVTGAAPELSTTGGISDARFIRALCPVVELGLVGATMHAVDEQVPLQDLNTLQAIYGRLIERYFAAFAV